MKYFFTYLLLSMLVGYAVGGAIVYGAKVYRRHQEASPITYDLMGMWANDDTRANLAHAAQNALADGYVTNGEYDHASDIWDAYQNADREAAKAAAIAKWRRDHGAV